LWQTSTSISTGINIDYGVQFDPLLNVGVNDVSASMTASVAALIAFGGHLLGSDEMVRSHWLSDHLYFRQWRRIMFVFL
jgi:hypothetical protein